jgi:hypothetical protein
MATPPRQSCQTLANTVLKYTPARQQSGRTQEAKNALNSYNRINSPPRQLQSHTYMCPGITSTHAANVLKYTSPRCQQLDDDEFLPSVSLQEHDERWKHMSLQAGPHQQDGSVLDLTSRRTSPQTLKVGVPSQVASRVRELHLHMEDSLPEWLDVVSSLFFNLQHLYTFISGAEEENNNTESARMRRLYILYRFPDLISIDGKPVTKVERQLARPSSPNGYKVKREDWVIPTNVEESSDSEEESSMSHGDAVEVSLFGVVKRVSADPPREEWDEPELPKPYEPAKELQSHTRAVQSRTQSVEKAYRTIHKPQQRSNGESSSSTARCGNSIFGTLGGGNPCVGSSRAPLDEPRTFEYQDATTRAKAHGDKRVVPLAGSKSQTLPLLPQTDKYEVDLSPERQERTLPIKTSPSTSLSSPFPIQFRSNSFNGSLPSRRHGLKKENSAPDLVPDKQQEVGAGVESSATKGTIESPSSPKWSSLNGRSRRAERPPPCPGARRVVPVEKGPRRRSWRNKSSIRRTSIVDDFDDDDDDDSCSTEEELIE